MVKEWYTVLEWYAFRCLLGAVHAMSSNVRCDVSVMCGMIRRVRCVCYVRGALRV